MYRLKECREMRGLSQKEVAATLKVSAPSVSNWESEKTRPTHDNLEKLADLYGVSVDYLLGRDAPAEMQKEKPADFGGTDKDELSDDERELLRLYRQLNAEGREKALGLLDDLVATGKYVQKNNAALMAALEA